MLSQKTPLSSFSMAVYPPPTRVTCEGGSSVAPKKKSMRRWASGLFLGHRLANHDVERHGLRAARHLDLLDRFEAEALVDGRVDLVAGLEVAGLR